MARHCVVIPFFGRLDQVERCLTLLIDQRTDDTSLLLADDGSLPRACDHLGLRRLLGTPGVHLIQHESNQGVSAIRNSALHWCRKQQFDHVIMLDSDCVPQADFIAQHLRLRQEFPEAACIAGAVTGRGRSSFAKLDGLLSWPASIPQGGVRNRSGDPYHPAAAHLAVNPSLLPARDFIFDERLATGEDCLLARELSRTGAVMLFSPSPLVFHDDRETLADVIAHQAEWGHHEYFIQLGGDLSPRVFNPLYRAAFVPAFALALPFFAITGGVLNLLPWLRAKPAVALLLPAASAIWFAKGLAVLSAAMSPMKMLRELRASIAYTEIGSVEQLADPSNASVSEAKPRESSLADASAGSLR